MILLYVHLFRRYNCIAYYLSIRYNLIFAFNIFIFSDILSIESRTSQLMLSSGSKLRLHCFGSSINKQITVTWIKNNQIVARNLYSVSIEKFEGRFLINSTLIIQPVNTSHSGKYICKFGNQFNTITSDANLVTVVGKCIL